MGTQVLNVQFSYYKGFRNGIAPSRDTSFWEPTDKLVRLLQTGHWRYAPSETFQSVHFEPRSIGINSGFRGGHWDKNVNDTDTCSYKRDRAASETINAPVYMISRKRPYEFVKKGQEQAEEEDSTVVAVEIIENSGTRSVTGY